MAQRWPGCHGDSGRPASARLFAHPFAEPHAISKPEIESPGSTVVYKNRWVPVHETEEIGLVGREFPLALFQSMMEDGRIQDASTVAAFGLLRLKGWL